MTYHTCIDGTVKYYQHEEHFVHFCTQQFNHTGAPVRVLMVQLHKYYQHEEHFHHFCTDWFFLLNTVL